jgi:hypothetical protein
VRRLTLLLAFFVPWLFGCVGEKRLCVPVLRKMSLGLDGSRRERLFGVRLPGRLTLGRVYLRTQPYVLEPLAFELSSSVGMNRRRLRGLFLGGQVGLSFRLTDYLVWSVNYSTLLAFVFPGRGLLGFCLHTRARFFI